MKTPDIGQCVFEAFQRDPPTDRDDRELARQQDMRFFARASYLNHGGAQVSNCHRTRWRVIDDYCLLHTADSPPRLFADQALQPRNWGQ
jgi:hypothetical protein